MVDQNEDLNREIRQVLGEDPVQLNKDFSNLVVVDGIPIVDQAKAEKLEKFLAIRFGKLDAPAPQRFHMFLTPDAKGKLMGHGFCVAEFANAGQAEKAVQNVNGKAFDKQHRLTLTSYNKFLSLMDVPEELPSEERDLAQEQRLADLRASLLDWMLDPASREQLLLRAGPECEVIWNNAKDPKNPQQLLYSQTKNGKGGPERMWADQNVVWSPRGSMAATHHKQGVRLWGGKSFDRVAQFRHANTDLLLFSPQEQFLITSVDGRPADGESATVIWNTFTETAVHTGLGKLNRPDPRVRWSHDDQYLALIEEDKIRLFQTYQDRVEELAPILVEGVNEARWSPDQNVLVYTVPEKDNVPCKVILMSLPDRVVIRERQLYNVMDVSLEWQMPRGEFLSVKMVRTKKGKPTSTNVELFRLREKDVPVESIEFKEPVHDLKWEPYGRRLIVIHGSENQNRTLELLQLQKTKVKSVLQLTGKDASRVFWNPLGTYAVFVQQEKGVMEFFDAQNGEIIASGKEHFMMNGLEWSPDGQYVLTSTCTRPDEDNWRLATESGYKIWNKMGDLLLERKIEHCFKVEWRPRPPSPLSPQEQLTLRTQLREKYWKRFEAEDEQFKFQLQGDEAKERQALREQWKAFRAEALQAQAEERKLRQERFHEDLDLELIAVETVMDTEIDTKTGIFSS